MLLSVIAAKIGGQLSGADVEVTGVSDLSHQEAGTIGFAENQKFLNKMEQSPVAALLIPENLKTAKPAVVSQDVRTSFRKLLELFNPYQTYPVAIAPGAHIDSTAKLGKDVTVMPFACIMAGAVIGDRTVIYPHVFIGRDVKIGQDCVLKAGVKVDDLTEIGDRVIIHHNSVVGGDGFGYQQREGRNIKVPQIGRIRIGSDCELGALVAVDRAAVGLTEIGQNVIVDNLVQIAHNVKIGDHSIVVSQSGIAGSSTMGHHCILAGQVGVADHVKMGNEVVMMARSAVESNEVIEDKTVLLGTPARPIMEEKRIISSLGRLPELLKRVKELEKRAGIEN